jgi:hypothetical protein
VREQVELLEHHADAAPDGVDVHVQVGDLDALDVDVALGRHLQQVHAAQQRRLAGARGPDHAHHLAGLDQHVDAHEHLVGAEVLVQVLDLDGVGHRRVPLSFSSRPAR